jgi:hypothetical protein
MRFERKVQILFAEALHIFGLEKTTKISQHNLEDKDIRLHVLIVIYFMIQKN